jgi:hypothetical protein
LHYISDPFFKTYFLNHIIASSGNKNRATQIDNIDIVNNSDLVIGNYQQNSIMAKYKVELADTYISYSGSGAMYKVNDYVRIDGPSVWIEYSKQIHKEPFPYQQPMKFLSYS